MVVGSKFRTFGGVCGNCEGSPASALFISSCALAASAAPYSAPGGKGGLGGSIVGAFAPGRRPCDCGEPWCGACVPGAGGALPVACCGVSEASADSGAMSAVASLFALSNSCGADRVLCATYQITPITPTMNSTNTTATMLSTSRRRLLRGFASSALATGGADASVGLAIGAETIG